MKAKRANERTNERRNKTMIVIGNGGGGGGGNQPTTSHLQLCMSTGKIESSALFHALLYALLILVVISVAAALTAAVTATTTVVLLLYKYILLLLSCSVLNNFVCARRVYMRLLSHLVCHVSFETMVRETIHLAHNFQEQGN